MKATILQGSPRSNGNTATLANSFAGGFRSSGGNEAVIHYLNGMNIRQCQGCMHCQQSLETLCALDDDMSKIYRDWLESDVIVFATPVYWWHVTGVMKTMIDRLQALLLGENTANFMGKTLVLIVTYGVEDAVGINTVLMMFEDIAAWSGTDLRIIRFCSAGGPASANEAKLDEAAQLGKALAGGA